MAIHASELACLFAVLALLLGLLTVVQWGELRRRQMPADWGNVPGWVGPQQAPWQHLAP